MSNCCENKGCEITALREKQGIALKIVFFINLAMFIIEFIAGLKAQSTALLGDSLDMLGDAFVYGFSLYVLNRSSVMKARAAQLKGSIMLVFGFVVLGQAIYKIATGVPPVYETMGVIGSLALAANLVCLWILYSHREDDINMQSTWICSRNDIIANVGTLGAALFVAYFNSIWPDILMGGLIAFLFLRSSFDVLKRANAEIKKGE